MRKTLFLTALFSAALAAASAFANVGSETYRGNRTIDSFNQAKKIQEREIVFDHRFTIYCGIPFDAKKNTILPKDFYSPRHAKRDGKIEWEHVVPAENFGRFFSEWRDGSPDCVDSKGKPFKGRKCAEKVNMTYRYMQSDLYNLYPAVGSVNAERGHKNFEALSPNIPGFFGSCDMKISGDKAQPPQASRGVVARTYKYMAWAYPNFRLSAQQQRLMDAWDKAYPVQKWECVRAKRIERIQGNENPFVKEVCRKNGQW